jgi:hypothetical protein
MSNSNDQIESVCDTTLVHILCNDYNTTKSQNGFELNRFHFIFIVIRKKTPFF